MDELLTVKGIGKATAAILVAAGIATIALLAAADPDQPIEGVDADKWKMLIANAKETPAPTIQTPANAPAAAETKDNSKGLVCKERCSFGRKTYAVGDKLPDDLSDEAAEELRSLKIID